MSLFTLADWSMVVFGFGWMALTVGVVLFKFFVLIDRVGRLEDWANEVSDELEALQQQRRDEALCVGKAA